MERRREEMPEGASDSHTSLSYEPASEASTLTEEDSFTEVLSAGRALPQDLESSSDEDLSSREADSPGGNSTPNTTVPVMFDHWFHELQQDGPYTAFGILNAGGAKTDASEEMTFVDDGDSDSSVDEQPSGLTMANDLEDAQAFELCLVGQWVNSHSQDPRTFGIAMG